MILSKLLLIMGYANLRKTPINKESITKISIWSILYTFSEKLVLDLIQSTIFIAGNAMKTSMTTEKTNVKTILIIFIFHSSDVQN